MRNEAEQEQSLLKTIPLSGTSFCFFLTQLYGRRTETCYSVIARSGFDSRPRQQLFFPLFFPLFCICSLLFCSTRISKVGKCAALQLWTPTYFSNKHFEVLKKVKSRPCTKGWKKQTSNLKLVWWPSYSSRFWTCIYHPRDQLSAPQTSFGFPLAPKSISGQKGVEILSCCLEGN